MKRSTVIVSLAATAALLAPGTAAAKEPTKVRVCGLDACQTVTERSVIAPLVEGGPPTDPPSRQAGWYKVTVTIGGHGAHGYFTNVIVPSQKLIGSTDVPDSGGAYVWLPMTALGARIYTKITSTLKPFPAATLAGTYTPPARAAVEPAAPVWPWIAAALAALAGGLVLVLRRRRTPHARGPAPP